MVFLFCFLCFGTSSFSSKSLSFLTADVSNLGEDIFVKPASNFLRESPSVAFLQENSVVAVAPPSDVDPQVLGAVLGAGGGELVSDGGNNVAEYIVQPGDSLSSIASRYNISLQTLLWANDLTSKSVISSGQKLVILPVSGVLCHVKSGDTLSEIAELYKGQISEIIEINGLEGEANIYVGDILIIPGGKIPKKSSNYAVSQVPIGSSYFICPHANCYISQGLHWYNAIDFAGKCGDPIVAAAAGTVQKVSYGWNGGAGNYVRILHPNGVITMYGHVQTALVGEGEQVSQGGIIALMGGKPGTKGAGISTGCHVHFDVRGARNPFAK